MPCGKQLRILLMDAVVVHWSLDGWKTTADTDSKDSGWNLQYVDLPSEELPSGRQLVFTFYWKSTGRWENKNYQVTIE
jgi:glucoamylase